ncbi:MAG: hypothetical protein ACI9FR_000518 [Cryomorphaceae bacterium]|jgi:hypothetical protein
MSFMSFDHLSKRTVSKLTWPVVVFLIIVLVVFTGIRVWDTFGGYTGDDLFETRYLDHPIISVIHMFCGITFLLFAPFQFSAKIRARNIRRHRMMGRVLVVCALVSGVYGIVSVVALPVFGGLSSASAGWLFGSIFLFCIMRALWCARNKLIAAHREWMIRTLAIALGVASQRVFIFVFMFASGFSFEEIFGPALWLGFGINLMVAEIWINLSRTKR